VSTNSEIVHQVLKKHWHFDTFRAMQEEIILSVMEKRDTLALLPTGGGKSICFQVPAIALPGFCLVISPLIALMKDHVENLKKREVKAAAIYSGMSQYEIDRILSNALFDPEFKLLYVSPERLKTDIFRANISRMKVNLIAVDEAHCISQWGYDFRPPYLEIAEIRPWFPDVPVLALTATATPEVVLDIQHQLKFKKENLFQKSFKRENLIYFIVKEEDKMHRMLRIMKRYPGTGIVYVRNRRRTREITHFLSQNGITADFYHAGLDMKERDARQKAWMDGTIRVIVSTNAFGMGIDKPDVRFVIHLDIPDTLEAYFQEAGRGGRDEKEAVAILLYDNPDIRELKTNFELSFPPLSVIRKIYEDLMKFHHLAMNEGQYCSFPFDLDEMAHYCSVKPVVLFNALTFLEKSGLLLLDESVRQRSVITMKLNQSDFDSFYKKNPQYEEFVKILLRSFGGIFTDYVTFSEKELARRLELKPEEVVKKLYDLQKLQVIDYKPSLGKQQITFMENRVESNYLYLEPKVYQQRKSVTEKRLKEVFHFIENEDTCRSQALLAYFGETKSTTCHQCDVCVRKERHALKNKEYDQILTSAIHYLSDHQLTSKELFAKLSENYSEDKVTEILRWMNDQKKL
jgi:ATP-dependent DNA helicase RecQ